MVNIMNSVILRNNLFFQVIYIYVTCVVNAILDLLGTFHKSSVS